jgi:hypothetical protein
MRLAGVLLSAILLLPCVSAQAYDVESGAIAVPSMNVPDMSMPAPLTPGPNMDMPETKPTPLVKPNTQSTKTDNTSSSQTQAAQEAQKQKAQPMDVSGKWSIKFDDGGDRSLDLDIWSSAGAARIMGFGTLTDEGTQNSVTAAGSLTAQEISLTTKLATPEYSSLKYDECDLDLFMANDTLSGTYILRSAGQLIGRGNATAVKL